MKKILSLTLVTILVFSLSACSKSENTSSLTSLDNSTVLENTSSLTSSDTNTSSENKSESDLQNNTEASEKSSTNTDKNKIDTPSSSSANITTGTSKKPTNEDNKTSSTTTASKPSQVPSDSTSSSVHPTEEICPKRDNSLPHRFSNATCTNGKVCDFCGREYGTPLGHTISKNGICKNCNQPINVLTIQYNNPFVFDGIEMDLVDYDYNTYTNRLILLLNRRDENQEIREFFIKATLYNGSNKISQINCGMRDMGYVDRTTVVCDLTKDTNIVVLENLL